MVHAHHHHLNRIGTFTEVRRLYWSRALSALANGLVAIFVPLYFLNLGYSFQEVLLYFLAYGASNLLVCYPMMRLMTKIGPNRSMAVGNLLLLFFFAGLISLPHVGWPLPLLAFIAAMSNEAYFPALHSNFSASETPGKGGRQISIMYALTATAGAASPLIGGVVASTYGIEYIYAAAAGLFVLAAIPLLRSREVVTDQDISLGRLKGKEWLPDAVGNFGFSCVMIADLILWPVLVFLLVDSYALVGGLSTILVLGSVATALYVGRREERKGAKHYLKQGTFSLAAVNLLRGFASSAGHVFGLNIVGGIGTQLAGTTFTTRFYSNANQGARLAYIRLMEYAWFTAWSLLFAVLYGLSFLCPPTEVLVIGLLLVIPASFLMQRIR